MSASAPFVPLPPASPSPSPQISRRQPSVDTGDGFQRILVEAEWLRSEQGWRSIAVGQGNYMVDSIGASHVSGGAELHAGSSESVARAVGSAAVPAPGRFRLWARYEYPYFEYSVAFQVTLRQGDRVQSAIFGRRGAMRSWFFGLPDAPWQALPNGSEGLVAESHDVELQAGEVEVVLTLSHEPGPSADRNIDALFLTDDLADTFRSRGVKSYPLLDEFGWAAHGRFYARLTNPPDADRPVSFNAVYSINRAPWTVPLGQIDRTGLISRQASAQPLRPGEQTPWIDLSCRDTTHDCHLNLRANASGGPGRGIAVDLELASAPHEQSIIRRLQYREPSSDRLLLDVPPYPAREPDRLLTGEEQIARLLAAPRQAPAPVGRPPSRFLLYGDIGDGFGANVDRSAVLFQRYRDLLLALGVDAISVEKPVAAVQAAHLFQTAGRPVPASFDYGGYRWFPTAETVARAQSDIQAAGAGSVLRGFNLGDEVKLSEWMPTTGRDDAFRAWLRQQGADPRAYLSPGEAGTGPSDEEVWSRVRLPPHEPVPADGARLFVDGQRFLEQAAVQRVAEGVRLIRQTFGDEISVGANFSPHPYFWPLSAQWVSLFRDGGLNRATQDDYWWQIGELGPEMAGYLDDVLRAGLDGKGVLQPYVMPHSPGNTDRDFNVGVATALLHGATALDFFNLGPEQTSTENYLSARDPKRYLTVREAAYALGAVEDLLLDGRRPPAQVGL
ncbi:MAG: hypothetical protein IT307_17465, partial [Chloroflexi bacterium]|nr:hypothetical protein [Chloroflexota bacterium]